MSQKQRIPEVNTAAQIVKGATVRVLGSNVPTVSAQCQKKNEGRLTIQHNQQLTQQQLEQIEKLANETISKNLDVVSETLDRSEAEKKYGKENIYDKIQPPEQVQQLSIVSIQDWVVNSCLGTHVAKTGNVRRLKVARQNFREAKNEVEIVFDLVDAADDANNNKGKGKANASTAQTPVQTLNYEDTDLLAAKLLQEVIEEMKKNKIDLQGKEETLVQTLLPSYKIKLNSLKNASFSRGFGSAHKPELTKMM